MPVLKIKKSDGTWQEVWGCTSVDSGGTSVVADSVLCIPQDLTEEQKAQARENIGAAKAECVTPQMFGAVGDGVADDTEAIMAARAKAIAEKRPLYFPAGTYLLSNAIELWDGANIFGDGSNSIITKIPAVTKEITNKASLTAGSSPVVVTVDDASGFSVGQGVCVGHDWSHEDCNPIGVISSIVGNTITISEISRFGATGITTDFTRRIAAYPDMPVYISTSFSLFRSYAYKQNGDSISPTSVNNITIHDLQLDGNVQDSELRCYLNSCIYIDGGMAGQTKFWNKTVDYEPSVCNENIKIYNLLVKNSSGDGLSIQSSNNIDIQGCVVTNCKYNGIHLGMGSSNAVVSGNHVSEIDYCGHFDCSGNEDVNITNNNFLNCTYGLGGFDSMTKGLNISSNTFTCCATGICASVTPKPANGRPASTTMSEYTTGNVIWGIIIEGNSFIGDYSKITASTTSGAGVGIYLETVGNTIVTNNMFKFLDAAFLINGIVQRSAISNNIIKECRTTISRTTTKTFVGVTFLNNIVECRAAEGTTALTSASVDFSGLTSGVVANNIIYGNNAEIVVDSDAVVQRDNLVG